MILTWLLLLVLDGLAQERCALVDPSASEEELVQLCQLNLCGSEPEIPRTSADLARLRAEHGLPAFKPQDFGRLRSAREAEQLLRATSARQVVESYLSSTPGDSSTILGFVYELAELKVFSADVIFNSSATLTPEMSREVSRFLVNINAAWSLENLIEEEDQPGRAGSRLSEVALSWVNEFMEVSVDATATAPTRAEVEELRSFVREGRPLGTEEQRSRLARTIDHLKKKQVRDNRELFEGIVQESMRLLQESLSAALEQSEVLCDLRDYYNRRAQSVVTEGTLQTWQRQAESGLTSRVLPEIPQQLRQQMLAETGRCRVELKPAEQDYAAPPSSGGLRNLAGQVNEAIGELKVCSRETRPSDNVRINPVGEGVISLSASTLVYGNTGVYFHEIGHCYSRALKKMSFDPQTKARVEGLRSCLASMHGGSQQYVEEDFADWLSVRLSPESANFGCYLIDVAETHPYAARSSLYDSDPADKHSNVLFRAIHMHLARGLELHPSCSALMRQKDERPVACGF